MQADGPDADPMSVAREIALNRLTMRDHSRQELDDKLADKDVPEEVRTQLLDRFEELGLVNDAHFAQQWTGHAAAHASCRATPFVASCRPREWSAS